MDKILGIDTGTNSLGWAVVEKTDEGYRLLDKGSHIFQEGVSIAGDKEESRAAARTAHRGVRVGYYRTRLRKIALLRVMSAAGLCPPLSDAELKAWRQQKTYPANEAFRSWQATDDLSGINPYVFRSRCVHERLDMDETGQRYMLGRALYHIAQRRGFLSNRKDKTDDDNGGKENTEESKKSKAKGKADENDDRKVKAGISNLSKQMEAAGAEYLCDYFCQLYGSGQRIRSHYTARIEHYKREFDAICDRQELCAELREALERAIFYQRPLKSQKHTVGKCVFETKKPRCQMSHPLYEEFRMLQFINNIRLYDHVAGGFRPLSDDERERAKAPFFRKSAPTFDFADVAKAVAGKCESIAYYRDNDTAEYQFNYQLDTSVSGCPVTAALRGVFGKDWVEAACQCYDKAAGKTKTEVINDVWHALAFYSDESKLAEFARRHFNFDEARAAKFAKIRLPQAYGSMSLLAVTKMLPYLRRGIKYSHAAFLANVCKAVPAYVWSCGETREALIDNLVELMCGYDLKTSGGRTLEACVKDYLRERYNASKAQLDLLYHPSMTDAYPRAKPNDMGIYQLGSPFTDSVRNPMAMRSLHRLRAVVNRLLSEGKIDEHTEIHIEFARELNDSNKRQAIRNWQKEQEKNREKARREIIRLYKDNTGKDVTPSDTDVLKYLLWDEQKHKCIYTGRAIGCVAEFIGPNPEYDIEHTIPRSAGGDSTMMNLTLCESRFNREIKRTLLPAELTDRYDEILCRIQPWKVEWERLDKQIRAKRTNPSMDKAAKDKIIQARHKLILERDYWRGKYERFTMTEVPEGFSRRQGAGIGLISRLALAYLHTVFRKVYTRKGQSTSDFRKIWGIQEAYEKKERTNHIHHCIDAIVIACMGQDEYNRLAAYYHDEEQWRWYGSVCPPMPKPWPAFTEDIKGLADEVLVSHQTPDNMHKQVSRLITVGGRRERRQVDAARGALHKDKSYGAIQTDDGVRYVVRRPLSKLDKKSIATIVDPTVRAIVERAVEQGGVKALTGEVFMNEEKRIPIRKVRCFAEDVKNPLNIRQQRDLSDKEYKRQYHVKNDSNYLMAVYRRRLGCGKLQHEFLIVNALKAAAHYRASNTGGDELVPAKSPKGYPLVFTLKIGTMVLLYEKSPNEVWNASEAELTRRLYKVTKLSAEGRIKLLHHQEARMAKDVETKGVAYKSGEELRPAIRISYTLITALVEGYDFTIDCLGKIHRINK